MLPNNHEAKAKFQLILRFYFYASLRVKSKKQNHIKAASSDGRDLAPGTANRWLQNDREQ